jgi:hypothetical protein
LKYRVGFEKLGSKTRFPSGEFLPIRVFLLSPLPLTVLEKQVNIWIEKKKAEGRKSVHVPKQDNPHV